MLRAAYCSRAAGLAIFVAIAFGQTNSSARWQAQYTPVYSDGFEQALSTGSGLQLVNGASVVTDPALVIAGQASVRLSSYGSLVTNPAVVPLAAHTTYIFELQYRVLSYGSSDQVLRAWMQPPGNSDPLTQVAASPLLKNTEPAGTFSTGAETGSDASYTFWIAASADSDVIVDNVVIYRQDSVQTNSAPASWARLETAPFPRLGIWTSATTFGFAADPPAENVPFLYPLDQVESRLAFADVVVGLAMINQTWYPDSIRRLRALNPNMVILPYRISEEQEQNIPPPTGASVDLSYQFLQSVADPWYVRDSSGKYVVESDYPQIRAANISPNCLTIGGQTFISDLENWLTNQVFPSGMWDGIGFDNLLGHVNPHIPHSSDPANFDVDYNRNGLRDETPASVSDMTRAAAISALRQLRSATGGLQLITGNAGPFPELALGPYVNGYMFEGFNWNWNAPNLAHESSAGWRKALDGYREMQRTTLVPRINVLFSSGTQSCATPPCQFSTNPTAADIAGHRFSMGTALLDDGFYFYSLHGSLSAPLWFDEFSVDLASGNAAEDRTKKGYLGQPLTDATELTGAGSLVFQEDFEGASLPSTFVTVVSPPATVSVPGEVITGSGSLVLNNPDHIHTVSTFANTAPHQLQLAPATTYLLQFDWRILQTIDSQFLVDIFGGTNPPTETYVVPGVVAGDFGTATVPFSVPSQADWTIRFTLAQGGGKVAIDNVKLYDGGAGPWRRDFENGLVLVNPLSQPHTFSAIDLGGFLKRAGIRRIKGTQAPDINNGQPVTGGLTLAPFDAIILLADHIDAATSTCKNQLNLSGQAFPASGGNGSLSVTASSDCAWMVSGIPDWVSLTNPSGGTGNGAITYQVLADPGTDRSATLTIAGLPFTVEQTGSSIAGASVVGSLSQVASAGTWEFTLTAINLAASAAQARFNFADDKGNPLPLPLTFPQSVATAAPLLAATLDRTIAPNAQLIMESQGPNSAAALIGWGELLSNGAVSGFGTFSNSAHKWNAVVPLETRNASSYLLPFDNTAALATGVAVANLASAPVSIAVILRDDAGAPLGSANLSLPAQGHTSFMLNQQYSATAGKRGTVEFDTPAGGQISVLGLRANGAALTTLPVLANVSASGGSIAHTVFNGGFTNEFTLVNTGSSSGSVTP